MSKQELKTQKGEIECRIDGRQLEVAERRRAIGFVSPDLELYPELTTRENLDFFCRLRGIEERRGAELLDEIGDQAFRLRCLAGIVSREFVARLRHLVLDDGDLRIRLAERALVSREGDLSLSQRFLRLENLCAAVPAQGGKLLGHRRTLGP